jgi:hypothetical protein
VPWWFGFGSPRADDVHPDYTTRSEPKEILAALDALAAR